MALLPTLVHCILILIIASSYTGTSLNDTSTSLHLPHLFHDAYNFYVPLCKDSTVGNLTAPRYAVHASASAAAATTTTATTSWSVASDAMRDFVGVHHHIRTHTHHQQKTGTATSSGPATV